MDQQNLEKLCATSAMLPREEGEDKVVIITPNSPGIGKILIREDTILAVNGCTGCGKSRFNCSVNNQCSALLWGKPSTKKYYCLMVGLLILFSLGFVGTVLFCFTDAFNSAILSNMVLSRNSTAFEMWKNPAVKPTMKVRIFNYTNWEEVRSGAEEKLHVNEIGPYVYTQTIERVNIQFDGDQLTYQEKNTYSYEAEKSNGAPYDQVIVPNLPLLGTVAKAIGADLSAIGQFSLSSAIVFSDHPHPFVKLPVHSFQWGYDDSLIDVARPLLSLSGQLNFDKFGLLVTKNGTQGDKLTINTGSKDIRKMNILERVNGDTKLNLWGSAECNSIEASDGSLFPPNLLDRKSILHIFFPNLCRRLPFEYVKDVETNDGVQLLRYTFPKNVFDTPAGNPENQCYCSIDTGLCPPQGIINVSTCGLGVPVLVSFPHFYLGDPKLREDIQGLHPDPNKHVSYLDLHPSLGITLQGKSSLQLNIQVKKSSSFKEFDFLKQDIILPIAWIEMAVEDLPDNIRSLVYHGTYSTMAIRLGLTSASIIALLGSGLFLAIAITRWNRKPCAIIKKVATDTELK